VSNGVLASALTGIISSGHADSTLSNSSQKIIYRLFTA